MNKMKSLKRILEDRMDDEINSKGVDELAENYHELLEMRNKISLMINLPYGDNIMAFSESAHQNLINVKRALDVLIRDIM